MRAYFQLPDSSEVHLHVHTALQQATKFDSYRWISLYINTVLPDLAQLNSYHQAMRHTSILHLHFHTRLIEPRISSTTGRGSNIYASLF